VDFLELYTYGTNLEPVHQVATSSMSVPADAEGAFSVGATRGAAGIPDGLTIDALELFSSQGPTNDGRAKPDIAAPDYVSTASYGALNFPGTSAAAPHIAGAAALMKSENLTRDYATLRAFLVGLAIDLGAAGRDNQFGYGRLSLRVGLVQPPPADKVPPVIAIVSPTNGGLVGSRQPVIIGSLQDNASGIDASTIVLTIDGVLQILSPGDFDPVTGVLSFTPPAQLALGAHVVTLTAADLDGNQGNTATVGFRIALPVIASGLRMISLPYSNLATSDPVALFGQPLSQIPLWCGRRRASGTSRASTPT
jgi:subtilisin family serine protease